MYHASLIENTKAQIQSAFSGQSSLKCLVSTIAFGMVSEVYTRDFNLVTYWMLGNGCF